MIVYCDRTTLNKVSGLYATAQFVGQEQIDDQSPEVLAYLANVQTVPTPVYSTDPRLDSSSLTARVTLLETKFATLVNWLVANNYLVPNELLS